MINHEAQKDKSMSSGRPSNTREEEEKKQKAKERPHIEQVDITVESIIRVTRPANTNTYFKMATIPRENYTCLKIYS